MLKGPLFITEDMKKKEEKKDKVQVATSTK